MRKPEKSQMSVTQKLIAQFLSNLWHLLLMLYNILVPINHYTGNITTKCHSRNMSDNRDLTGVLHQKISSLPVSIASDTRNF